MRWFVLASAAFLTASPAFSQTTPELPVRGPLPADVADDTTGVSPVDVELVGTWELVEVEDEGELRAFRAVLKDMECVFEAEGEATVSVTVEQDRETIDSDRSFPFTTADGQILSEGTTPVAYAVLDTGELRLTMADGMTVLLQRAQE